MKRVLIASHHIPNLAILRDYLEAADRQVFAAENADQVAELLERRDPHVVVLDLDISNVCFHCEQIKATVGLTRTLVLMIASLDRSDELQKAIECGINDFIAMPVEKGEIVRRVENLAAVSLFGRNKN